MLFKKTALLLFAFSLFVSCAGNNTVPSGPVELSDKSAYERNYGNITKESNLNGLGGIIADPVDEQEQVCFTEGLCLNIITTRDPVVIASGGSLGCNKVKRMANVIRQVGIQFKQVMEKGSKLPKLVNALGIKGDELGNAMQNLEKCSITEGCDLNEAVNQLNLDKEKSLYQEFLALKEQVDTESKNTILQDKDAAFRVLNFQVAEISSIVTGVKTAIDPKTNETVLQFNKNYASPQSAQEICKISGLENCHIKLPKKAKNAKKNHERKQ